MDNAKNQTIRVLALSTSGLGTDGISTWITDNLSLLSSKPMLFSTIIHEGTEPAIVERLNSKGIRTHSAARRARSPLRYFLQLRKILRTQNIDIIHVNGNSGTVALELLAAVGTNARTRIVHVHSTRGEYPRLDRLLRPVMNMLVTDRFACGVAAGKWLFESTDFRLLANARDFNTYRFSPQLRTTYRERYRLSERETCILHVGNFLDVKNHEFLLEAFAAAVKIDASLKLFFVGDGPTKERMVEVARRLDIHEDVKFLGQSDEVPALLSMADAFVLPSKYEGLPTVVIEAQLSGLPCLVSTTITSEVVLTPLVQTGTIESSEQWTDWMLRQIKQNRENNSSAAQLALKGHGYDLETATDRLAQIYQELYLVRRLGSATK